VAQSSKVWDEVPFPEDLEEENKWPGGYVDDEEYDPSGGETLWMLLLSTYNEGIEKFIMPDSF